MLKNCIGAIDGTHVDARILQDQQITFCGRKINTTWNVMCACSFDMRFTFVMSGWEGTANDSRVLLECISNPNNKFSLPTRGIYYNIYIYFTIFILNIV